MNEFSSNALELRHMNNWEQILSQNIILWRLHNGSVLMFED